MEAKDIINEYKTLKAKSDKEMEERNKRKSDAAKECIELMNKAHEKLDYLLEHIDDVKNSLNGNGNKKSDKECLNNIC